MVSEFFNIKLYITQHMHDRLGKKEGVTFSKISSAVNSMKLTEGLKRPVFCDLGGTLGGASTIKVPQDPHVMSMNYLKYRFATLNDMDLNYLDRTSKAMRATYFPWVCTNVVQKHTHEPYFGQPYRILNVNRMKIAVLGAYGGYEEEKTKQVAIENLQISLKKWLRYLHSLENPDYVIVFVSNLIDEQHIDALKNSIEGAGILITGADYESDYKKQTESMTISRKHGEAVPLFHHVHNGHIMELDIRFKTRVNTFEYLGHSLAMRDEEFAKLREDIEYLDLVHRYL